MQDTIEKCLLENYGKYYRIAYSYAGNEADAMDIVQEAAYKAIKNSQKLKFREFADTWICRIVINEAKSLVRSRKDTEDIDDQQIAVDAVYENLDLREAMAKLTMTDRIMIELHYFERMPLKSVAEAMDMNVNTVKSRMYRSLKQLRLELD